MTLTGLHVAYKKEGYFILSGFSLYLASYDKIFRPFI